MSIEPKGTYAFVSLGCPKNLVDSERMLGKLAQDGYTLVPEADGADVVVVNTCGFIEPARQESLAVIHEMLTLKQQGKVGAVVVAGCLAERKKDDLLQQVPAVDHILGVVAQDTTYYGLDLYGRVRLAELLRQLNEVEGLEWIRILYAYPIHFTGELIETLAGCPKVLPYLDMPLQHINDRVLRRMQRRVN